MGQSTAGEVVEKLKNAGLKPKGLIKTDIEVGKIGFGWDGTNEPPNVTKGLEHVRNLTRESLNSSACRSLLGERKQKRSPSVRKPATACVCACLVLAVYHCSVAPPFKRRDCNRSCGGTNDAHSKRSDPCRHSLGKQLQIGSGFAGTGAGLWSLINVAMSDGSSEMNSISL
jgi:hypothetical protein